MNSGINGQASPTEQWRLGRCYWGLVLLISSIGVRMLVYLSLQGSWEWKPTDNGSLYVEALQLHLSRYIWEATVIPPVTYLLHAAVYAFGGKFATERGLFLLLVFLMDSIAVYLIYLAACRMHVIRGLAFVVCAFYSLALVPFELWRSGFHYDQYTTFFTALFIFACSRLLTGKSSRDAWLAAIAGSLLVLQSAVSAYVVPAVALVVLLHSAWWRSKLFREGAKVLVLPIAVHFFLVAKTSIVKGTFAVSTKAGSNMTTLVHAALENQTEEVRWLLLEAKVPHWYLWCFDHPDVPPIPNPIYNAGAFGARLYGICYPQSSGVESGRWPYDFTPLYEYLKSSGETRLAEVVAIDIMNARQRPYLLAGFGPSTSARWNAAYGRVTFLLVKQLALHYPYKYLRRVFKQYIFDFSMYGPNFPSRVLRPKDQEVRLWSYGAQSGLRSISTRFFLEPVFSAVAKQFRWVAGLTNFGVLGVFLIVLVLRGYQFIGWLRRESAVTRRDDDLWSAFSFVGVSVVLLSGIFAVATGSEHDRLFMQIVPYLMVGSGLILNAGLHVLGLMGRRWTERSNR